MTRFAALTIWLSLSIPPASALQEADRPSGLIGFDSHSPGGFRSNLFVMNADGSGVRVLTQEDKLATALSWSPDGRRIAFCSNRDGDFDIFVMNADGSGAKNLTRHAAKDAFPSWSPDGLKIAFVSYRDSAADVFVMDADGGHPTNLTKDDAEDSISSGAWSPDGRQIVFTSNRFTTEKIHRGSWSFEVCAMDADGGNVRNLTEKTEYDGMAAWAPDGSRISFVSGRDRGRQTDLYSMNPDGTEVARLTTDRGENAFHPAWSPDSQRIAFEIKGKNFSFDLYLVNADGSELKQLTEKGGMENASRPSWKPK